MQPRRKHLRPEERRHQLLDCAEALFKRKGYPATTITDVMEAAGVSKGGFYHHFDSKEALLEALAQRLAQRALQEATALLDDAALSPPERLNAFLAAMRTNRGENRDAIENTFGGILETGGIVLLDRIRRALNAAVFPTLEQIVREGAEQRVFDVPDVAAATEMILHINAAPLDAVRDVRAVGGPGGSELAEGRLMRMITMQSLAINRLLGLPDGTVDWSGGEWTRGSRRRG